ncbi:MAG: hypothetical protein C0404_04570 [Verrucomicrobia bacterium]|nr:hypothetical protein [Verrucomicrobiota bacterium]
MKLEALPDSKRKASPDDWHEFAWDGVSFEVPGDWNLSAHGAERDVSSVTMEDDYAVRLQAEWFVPGRKLKVERLKSRYDKHVAGFGRKAMRTEEIAGLPGGWMGHVYGMKDAGALAVVFHADSAGRMAFLALIHFPDKSNRDPAFVSRRLASSFKLHQGPVVPWRFYDVAFELDREFRLASTDFVAGRKHMVFEWQLRKLSLWFFSLADRVLNGQKPEEWAVDFLNKHPALKGPHFGLDRKRGAVTAKRSRLYPLGHFEEIGRACFRYHVTVRHDRAANTVMVRVFNYRKDSDLSLIRHGNAAK